MFLRRVTLIQLYNKHILYLSDKPQCRYADPDGGWEDGTQGGEAGMQSGPGGEDIINKKDMTDVF